MKIQKLFKLGLIFTIVAALLLSSQVSALAPGSKNVEVRIAFFPNITHSQALIGKATGAFQKAFGDSNKISWKQFNAGPAEIEALFAKEVDIGYIGPGPAINGFVASNGDLQIIAGATDAGAILVTKKGLKLKSVKELSGKKVAIPQFGNTQDLSLRNLLKQNGLKPSTKGGTVDIIQAENPDIKVLLDRGEIDAALVPEPWGSRLVKEVGANVLLTYNQVWRNGKYPSAVVIVRTDFLNEHPDLVEKFLRTHVELTRYTNKNLEKAKAITNAEIKGLTGKELSKDVLDNAFKNLTVTYDPETAAVKDFAKLALDNGFIKKLPDSKKLFNLTILNKILKEQKLSEVK